MTSNYTKCFFHVDLDAFFASVEQIKNPSLQGKPVIICGNPHQKRNVVSTASYEARKYGVHSAMPAIKAYKLCPNGFFIEPNMNLYYEYSIKVMNILKNYSPDILQVSIDEACLDMTGTTRLFGNEIETANKIKKEVKEKTGLTISIGIASNAYLAKICSDINKPDGLFQIKPGDEENFMINLPLKKVWGIGEKTLNRLNSLGLNSIKDIKSHSKNFLENILGKASSSFLYNICRGIEPENFRSKTKSHSISTETTFEFDLTDRRAIEVNILYLCSQLCERLLKENLTSLTVHLKIRYEDFTTVNIQNTYKTPVLCTDELYERAISLFDKKYEFNKGIRLIGVGLQNVVNSNHLIQAELFESKDLKKQSIEKAILNLKNKNPKIKIQRASFIDKIKTFAIILLTSFSILNTSLIYSSENTSRPDITNTELSQAGTITDETSLPPRDFTRGISLYNLTFDDKSIEFIAEGYWNTKLIQSGTATFGYDNDFTFDFGIPIFEQEVDLSLWFLLNNKWYLQGAFADKFSKSTFALGYKSDSTIKEIRLSNRNIVFPNSYSLSDIGKSIGGGDNQAPGISASFSKDKWEFDAVLRYDMLTSYDKTYYGNNSVNNLKIPKENFISGLIFIIPNKESIKQIENIYIEHYKGNYSDEVGRKYIKISSNDFLILANKNQVLLSSDIAAKKSDGTKPCVLIEFSQDADLLLQDELGTFGTSQTQGTKYLGQIQKYFGSKLDSEYKKPQVSLYSYGNKIQNISGPDSTGQKTEGFFVSIQNKKMLLAQNSIGFSPFIAAYRYNGGKTPVEDVCIASYSSEIKNNSYEAIITDSTDTVKNNFFDNETIYIDVYNPDYPINSTTDDGTTINYTSAQINFPFADLSPGTYLGFNSTNDDCILLKTYFKTSRIDIGTNAVEGTIHVYKNGILDNSAVYNPITGEINLSSGISDTDKIYITWSEETSNYESGMISGALGLKYNFLENLQADLAIASKWSLSPNLYYAEDNRSSNGYATISTKLQWKEEKISLSNTSGATFEVDNVTGIYKISSMDDNIPSTAYLASNAAKDLPVNFVPYLNNRYFSEEQTDSLTIENNCSSISQTGSLDENISGYKIPITYNFSKENPLAPNEVLWAANTIQMPANKNNLSNSSKFSLAVKLTQEFISLANAADNITKIYLQLGVNSESDFNFENKGNIPTWKIFDTSFISNENYKDVESFLIADSTNWQTITVLLNDTDRANFSEYYNARIIITTDKKPENATLQTGSIYVGPYEHVLQGIFTANDTGIQINTEQYFQNNQDANKFNKDDNYSENIFWEIKNFNSTLRINDPNIIAYKFFEDLDLSSYKNLNIYFSYEVGGESIETNLLPNISDTETGLTLTLDSDSKDAYSNGKKAIEVKIPAEELKRIIKYNEFVKGPAQTIHKLEINRITNEIFIDGIKINNANLFVNTNIIPNRLKIKFNTSVKTQNDDTKKLYQYGRFTIDEIFLSDNSPKIVLQNQFKANFSHKDDIIKIKDFELLKDANLFITSDVISSIPTDNAFSKNTDISANAIGNITLASIKIQNQIGRSPNSENIITSASHSINTTKALFKILTFSENYTINNNDKIVQKENNASLNFNEFNIPLLLKGSSNINYDSWSATQSLSESLNFSIGNKYKYDLSIVAKANQKTMTTELEKDFITDNYFSTWLNSTKYQFSFGNPNAQKRNISASLNNTLRTPILGFSPQINFSQSGIYYSTIQNMFSSDTNFQIILPFRIKGQNFSFNYSKSSTSIENVDKGGNYFDDVEKTLSSLKNRKWYFTALPIYDLFSKNLSKNISKSFKKNLKSDQDNLIEESINYNANYEIMWRRQIFASKKDLFIPTIASLTFARDITTAENLTDTYQGKFSVGYTAIDIFCKNGSIPILQWCEGDEYNLSLQSTLKIPRGDSQNIKQLYSAYFQGNFYKNNSDIFRTAFQFTFQDTSNWNGKFTFLYRRQSNFSPIISIIKLFSENAIISGIKIYRTNSLNFNAYSTQGTSSNSTKTQYQSFDFSHLLELQLNKQISINGNIAAIFSHTNDKTFTLGYELGLGAKLSF